MNAEAEYAHQTALSVLHGLFNVATGLWPVLHLRSFEAITGPKIDRWLVKTVGMLLAVIGATQIRARKQRDVALALGIGTAATLGGIDLVYVPKRRISAIYLLDAILEGGWIAAWLRRARAI